MTIGPEGTELRRIFGSFATGVTIVTGVHPEGRPVGVTANSFTSVSLQPPLVLWCLANSSTSLEAFFPGAPFAVHVLNAEQTDIALHFSRSNPQKIVADEVWRRNPQPPPIPGSLARMDCKVESIYPAGDHRIVLGSVSRAQADGGKPLLFFAGKFGVFGDPSAPVLEPLDAWSNTISAAESEQRAGKS